MARTKKRHWGDVFLVLFLLAGAAAAIVGCDALTAVAVETRGVVADKPAPTVATFGQIEHPLYPRPRRRHLGQIEHPLYLSRGRRDLRGP